MATPANRALRSLPLAILALSLLGLGIAGYLTYAHYNQDALVCTIGSCQTVQSSTYATIGAVPIAIFGAGMYVTLGALAAARRFRVGLLAWDTATMAAFGIVLAGFVYAAYLTYVELFVIDAICQWCVGSAIVTTLILVLESILLWKTVLGPVGGDAFD